MTQAMSSVFGDPRLPARFWAKVAADSAGCWLWTAYRNSGGYGQFSYDHRQPRGAHRVAYEVLVRVPAPGLQLDHLCRVRHCVRPDHLEEVTQKENLLRGVGRPAQQARQTTCVNGHPFDESNTRIRPGQYGLQRQCIACTRAKRRQRDADRQAAGLCVQCGKPSPGARQCAACLEWRRAYHARRKAAAAFDDAGKEVRL